jgi:hypothetical protein
MAEPTTIAGLCFGYRANDLTGADGSNVAVWPDKSVNANNLALTTTVYPRLVYNAINTKKAVDFDFLDFLASLCKTDGVGVQQAAFTFAAVIARTRATTGGGTICNAGPTTGGRSYYSSSQSSNHKMYLTKGQQAAIGMGNTAILTDGTWERVVVTFNASTGAWAHYLNGVSDGSGTTGGISFTAGNQISVGTTIEGSEPFRGKIAEVWMWDHVLSDPDRAILDAYWVDYYITPPSDIKKAMNYYTRLKT